LTAELVPQPRGELAPPAAPADPLADVRLACAPGRGVARIETLAALLAPTRVVRPRDEGAERSDVALAWGRKPSAAKAERWAAAQGVPVWRLEDGFLRSVELGNVDAPLSVVVDDQGIYYDADVPSRLEALVRRPLAEAEHARAQRLVARWRD